MHPLLKKAVEEGERAGGKEIVKMHIKALRYSASLAMRSGVSRERFCLDMHDVAATVWDVVSLERPWP
jgi:hypothetical protein